VSAVYRVWQFIHATGAWIRAEVVDEALIASYLPPRAVDLFLSMPYYDQQHALNVLGTLQGQGHRDPDLMAAALLHDLGKSVSRVGRPRLWHRVATVLGHAFWPDLLQRLSREDPGGGWRQPFYIQEHHATLGAQLAQEVGCSPVTVDLIRHHEESGSQILDPRLAALQAADSAN
jgi:putative nucleotidyltransferase with HDIG domain